MQNSRSGIVLLAALGALDWSGCAPRSERAVRLVRHTTEALRSRPVVGEKPRGLQRCPLPRVQERPVRLDVRYRRGHYDVFLVTGSRQTQLTDYRPWERIRKVGVSPDGRYGFVWHRPDKVPPLRLTLYCLSTRRKLAEIQPGTGGELHWNNANRLVHRWGCGTNCTVLVMYDLSLRVIFRTVSSGGVYVSPGRRFAVQLTKDLDDGWIYHLGGTPHAGRFPGARIAPLLGCPKRLSLDEPRMDAHGLIRFRYTCGTLPRRKRLTLRTLTWRPSAPTSNGQFYLRRIQGP